MLVPASFVVEMLSKGNSETNLRNYVLFFEAGCAEYACVHTEAWL